MENLNTEQANSREEILVVSPRDLSVALQIWEKLCGLFPATHRENPSYSPPILTSFLIDDQE